MARKPPAIPEAGRAPPLRNQKLPASPAELLDSIEAGNLEPVYCLYGEETYGIDLCVRALRKQILGATKSDSADLNRDVFDLEETGLAPALAAARTRTLLGGRRIVEARGIDLLRATELETLLPYLEAPNPDTCLILTTSRGEKVDGRLKVFATLRKAGWLHEFTRLKDRELGAWLAAEARRRCLGLEPEAARLLSAAAGPDLGRLAQSLEQLALYATQPGQSDRVTITRAHVEALVPETREHQLYELTRAISAGEPAKALRLLCLMLEQGSVPEVRLALLLESAIGRELRQIWRARELVRAGIPHQDLAAKLGVMPFLVDEIVRISRRLSSRTIVRALTRLYETDRTLKSSARVPTRVVLMRLVRDLAEACAT